MPCRTLQADAQHLAGIGTRIALKVHESTGEAVSDLDELIA
jgi:hypothetical protein